MPHKRSLLALAAMALSIAFATSPPLLPVPEEVFHGKGRFNRFSSQSLAPSPAISHWRPSRSPAGC